MTVEELEVAVMDGETLVQHCTCSRTTMPGGTPGVIWRGVAYRLLSGNRIDVGVPPSMESAIRHAVVAGEEASWVLIQGLPDVLAATRKMLEQSGVVVSRSGRWLGDPIGETAFDWFVRCDGRLDENQVAALLGPSPVIPVASDSAVRLSLMEQRIADLLADLARAESALRRSIDMPRPSEVAYPTPPVSRVPPEPDPALQNALTELQALQASLESVGADERLEPRPGLPTPRMMRTRDEVSALLAVLRPDILFMRDSLLVALGEFHSRSGFYKALNELPASGSRPEGWKMLRGAERWWERHISTGRNDHARVYARYDTMTRQWSLLLGWKVAQLQDITWLRRQG